MNKYKPTRQLNILCVFFPTKNSPNRFEKKGLIYRILQLVATALID